MPQALANFRELWERTSLIQRVILLGIVLACVGASALLLGWARQPHLVPLYAGLDPEDAAKIVEKIRDEGVPYEVTAGGTAVSVPADQVYTLKLSLAGSGLPAGRAQGYRILDEGKIGTSPFKERVNYIRAIEGELAKTIELLDGVQRVRVHIVRPESPLFAGQQDNSSATVADSCESKRMASSSHRRRSTLTPTVLRVSRAYQSRMAVRTLSHSERIMYAM